MRSTPGPISRSTRWSTCFPATCREGECAERKEKPEEFEQKTKTAEGFLQRFFTETADPVQGRANNQQRHERICKVQQCLPLTARFYHTRYMIFCVESCLLFSQVEFGLGRHLREDCGFYHQWTVSSLSPQ